MAAVRGFIFDFGGVFTDSPFTAVHDFGRELGIDVREMIDIVFGSYEHDGDHPWHRLERGEITLESARSMILDLGGERGHQVDIYDLFARMAGDNAGAGSRQALVDKVAELRDEGYPTGIVTNNVVEFGDGWRSLIPVDDLFDWVVDSSAEGVRKPDPRIFELALAQWPQFAPQEVVFLDDYPANVATAARLGMRTITVGPDLDEVLQAIDALL